MTSKKYIAAPNMSRQVCEKCRKPTHRMICNNGLLVCPACVQMTRSSGNFWRQWVYSDGAGCWPHEIEVSRAYCDKMGFHCKFREDGTVGFNDRTERKRYLKHYDLQER